MRGKLIACLFLSFALTSACASPRVAESVPDRIEVTGEGRDFDPEDAVEDDDGVEGLEPARWVDPIEDLLPERSVDESIGREERAALVSQRRRRMNRIGRNSADDDLAKRRLASNPKPRSSSHRPSRFWTVTDVVLETLAILFASLLIATAWTLIQRRPALAVVALLLFLPVARFLYLQWD
jgi:hypothetical protein